jgi:peptidoglycan hydrolase-like protein with peptidoglycan-binding domain
VQCSADIFQAGCLMRDAMMVHQSQRAHSEKLFMMQRICRNSNCVAYIQKISPPCDHHATAVASIAHGDRGTLSRVRLFSLVEVADEPSRNNDQRGTTMRRNVKTILMGTVALMAGVGLASAQGMRDAPGSAGDRGAPSSQMTPDSSGSHREMKGGQDKAEKSLKSETRGQAQQGPSRKDMKGQAKSESHERSTTGQGASDKEDLSKSPNTQGSKAGNKDELKSKSSSKPAEKSTKGQAAGDSAKDKAGKNAASQKNERSTTGQGSPDSKASSDSKSQTQPMNRQSQDPNATKQKQTTGAANQSNSTEPTASIRSQAGVQVSSQQRTTIQRSVLEARNVPRVDRVSFSIHTGTVVPRNVRIVSVTTFPALIEVFPRYREYSFFVVEDEVVFVDRSHKIVDVVSFGGGGHIGSASASTTVAVDLSEPEIREVQTVLIREGYLRGRITGVFDTRTRTALISFQRKRGFEANGRIDARTVTALGLEGKVKVKSESSSSSSSSSSSQSSSTTGQGSGAAQKSDQKGASSQDAQKPNDRGTTGQGPTTTQQNATPNKGPSERKGSGDAQPAQKDQRSSAPSKSTTGQGSSDKADQNSSGSSQPPAANGQNEKRRQ